MRGRVAVVAVLAVLLACVFLVLTFPAPPTPPPRLDDLLSRATQLCDEGRALECETVTRRALTLARAEFGPRSGEAAAAMELVARAMCKGTRGASPEALDLAEEALRIEVALVGPDDPRVAGALMILGQVHVEAGRYPEARAAFERALQIREASRGPDAPEVADALTALGSVQRFRGDLPGSRASLERALAILSRSAPEHRRRMTLTLYHLAELERVEGNYPAALARLDEALAVVEDQYRLDNPMLASVLATRGGVLGLLGRDDAAFADLERAASIQSRAGAGSEHALARTLTAQASLLERLGDLEGAREHREKVVTLWETLGREHQAVAGALVSLGGVLVRQGELARARECLERALAIQRKVLGPEHHGVARSLSLLASVARREGDTAEAERLLEDSLAIAARVLKEDHPAVGAILREIGEVRLDEGADTAAAEILERALAIQEGSLGRDHPEVAITLIRLAEARRREGRRGAALNGALEAAEILDGYFRRTARSLLEREIVLLGAAEGECLAVALSCLEDEDSPGSRATSVSRVWSAAIRAKARALDEMASRRRDASARIDPATEADRRRLDLARSRLAALVVAGPEARDVAGYRRKLEAAETERSAAERNLLLRSAPRRREEAWRSAGLADVRAARPEGSAVVAYVRYARGLSTAFVPPALRYAAFVQPPGDAPAEFVPLGDAGTIDDLVAQWWDTTGTRPPALRGDATRAESACRQVGSRLRRAVWEPVAPLLRDAEIVFVAPDAAVHFVGFEALPAEEDRYLVERAPPLQRLSAERDLVRLAWSEPPGTGLLVVGAPDYGAPQSKAGDPGSTPGSESAIPRTFGPLPGAQAEAEEIARIWDGTVLLTGGAAREQAFRRLAPGREILHVATHAFALERRPGVATEPAGALLRSGLALAGANLAAGSRTRDGDDDGILMAEEIAALDLRGVRWAVLSACDTGRGDVLPGEGVFGLRRAFEIAGVRSVVTTLWPVEDEAARAWMRSLYRNRIAGASTAAAVQAATVESLERRRAAGRATHPYYWASFVAAGDWR